MGLTLAVFNGSGKTPCDNGWINMWVKGFASGYIISLRRDILILSKLWDFELWRDWVISIISLGFVGFKRETLGFDWKDSL